jgi:hypothetical protein
VFRDRKFSLQEGVKPLASDLQVFFRDLRGTPYVELEAAVAARIEHMDQ